MIIYDCPEGHTHCSIPGECAQCDEKLIPVNYYPLTDREVSFILASLRNWQLDTSSTESKERLSETFAEHFVEHEPLSDEEIDALCERINFE